MPLKKWVNNSSLTLQITWGRQNNLGFCLFVRFTFIQWGQCLHSLFINNKNIIHSAWTHISEWYWTVALVPAKALFISELIYTLAIFLLLQITMGFGWQKLRGGKSQRKLTLPLTYASSLTFFACWKPEMALIWT